MIYCCEMDDVRRCVSKHKNLHSQTWYTDWCTKLLMFYGWKINNAFEHCNHINHPSLNAHKYVKLCAFAFHADKPSQRKKKHFISFVTTLSHYRLLRPAQSHVNATFRPHWTKPRQKIIIFGPETSPTLCRRSKETAMQIQNRKWKVQTATSFKPLSKITIASTAVPQSCNEKSNPQNTE